MVNIQNLIAIDTEGGKRNGTPLTVALVSSAYKTLYCKNIIFSILENFLVGENIRLNSPQFSTMQAEVKRIIASNVVVAHGVQNDLMQVGLSGIRCAQTDSFGKVTAHKAEDDAKRHMELAVSWN